MMKLVYRVDEPDVKKAFQTVDQIVSDLDAIEIGSIYRYYGLKQITDMFHDRYPEKTLIMDRKQVGDLRGNPVLLKLDCEYITIEGFMPVELIRICHEAIHESGRKCAVELKNVTDYIGCLNGIDNIPVDMIIYTLGTETREADKENIAIARSVIENAAFAIEIDVEDDRLDQIKNEADILILRNFTLSDEKLAEIIKELKE